MTKKPFTHAVVVSSNPTNAGFLFAQQPVDDLAFSQSTDVVPTIMLVAFA